MKWITGKVIKVIHWTEKLFSLIVCAPIDPFISGQFTRLGMNINNKFINRAYSYVNSSYEEKLEFYIVSIPGGKLSPFLQNLKPGNELVISKKSYGFFTIDSVGNCKYLWMLATGTALGPYLSILKEKKRLERFDSIILVYAVRFFRDISYLNKIKELQKDFYGKLKVQIVISREKVFGTLHGRIPDLIENGTLENSLNLKLNMLDSRIMLCGNPGMIRDTKKLLYKKLGMRENLQKKPGHLTIEKYW